MPQPWNTGATFLQMPALGVIYVSGQILKFLISSRKCRGTVKTGLFYWKSFPGVEWQSLCANTERRRRQDPAMGTRWKILLQPNPQRRKHRNRKPNRLCWEQFNRFFPRARPKMKSARSHAAAAL